jgi:hypothetical protein
MCFKEKRSVNREKRGFQHARFRFLRKCFNNKNYPPACHSEPRSSEACPERGPKKISGFQGVFGQKNEKTTAVNKLVKHNSDQQKSDRYHVLLSSMAVTYISRYFIVNPGNLLTSRQPSLV